MCRDYHCPKIAPGHLSDVLVHNEMMRLRFVEMCLWEYVVRSRVLAAVIER